MLTFAGTGAYWIHEHSRGNVHIPSVQQMLLGAPAREKVERVQPAQIQLCSSTSATTLCTLRPAQIARAVSRLSVARDPASTARSLLLGAGRRVGSKSLSARGLLHSS